MTAPYKDPLPYMRAYDPFRNRDPLQLAMEVSLGNFKNIRALRHQKFFMKYIQELEKERQERIEKQKAELNHDTFKMPRGNLWEVGSSVRMKPSIPMDGILPKAYSITDTMPYHSRVAETMLKPQRDIDDTAFEHMSDDLSSEVAKLLEDEFRVAVDQEELKLKSESKGDKKTKVVDVSKVAEKLVSRSDLEKRYGKAMGGTVSKLTIQKLAAMYGGKSPLRPLRPGTISARTKTTLKKKVEEVVPQVPGLE